MLARLGPGLLFAAITVGVSHLVMATRAGAGYGFAMLLVILFANATKYPAFMAATVYSSATGQTLIEAYRRQGVWALVLLAVIMSLTMFVALAAISLLCAGLFNAALGTAWDTRWLAVLILVATALLLAVGRYRLLEAAIKVLVVAFAIATLVATALVLPELDWSGLARPWPVGIDMATLLFTASLIGWMPGPLDTAVFQSVWIRARVRNRGALPPLSDARFDFNVGFGCTVALSVCFMLLGAALLYGKDLRLAADATGFSLLLLSVYTESLGEWSRPLIAFAAVAVIYSTLLTVVDAYPRSVAALIACARHPEPHADRDAHGLGLYLGTMVLVIGGAALMIHFLGKSFGRVLDIATTVSFVFTPVLAWLNHRAVIGPDVPAAARPGPVFVAYSAVCITLMTLFSCAYLMLRITE
ncbi:MAG: divalent metal cation transporter [Gammaproteobacteria bacterium]|nr:divalent metal cation transporter [Gammaproteobacteria bacterium]